MTEQGASRADPALSIASEKHEADFALLDRYQAFSAELLRLSLLGIGGIGFFAEKLELGAIDSPVTRTAAWFALAGFALCISGSLAHRYYSSDGMHHHLRAARSYARGDPASAELDRALRAYPFTACTSFDRVTTDTPWGSTSDLGCDLLDV